MLLGGVAKSGKIPQAFWMLLSEGHALEYLDRAGDSWPRRTVHLDPRPHSMNMGIDRVGPNIPIKILVENGKCIFKSGISDTVEF